MHSELECDGQIRFGPLPWETSERLAQFGGNWLQYAPGENAVLVRQPQPIGCPAFTAVPCELLSMMHAIPPELREFIPGGCLHVRDSRGEVLRIVVERGEIRVQWPAREDKPVPVTADVVLHQLDPKTARVDGWARFAGACERAAELKTFVEQFEGLYPEGDLPSECEQNLVYVKFRGVNVGPSELIDKLRQLSESQESLQGELEITSFAPGSRQPAVRIIIRDGQLSALRLS